MAIRLGDLLLQHKIITEQQLNEALRAQQIFGGRLGSNLIELGFVSETTLAKVLSHQLRLPCAEASAFDAIAPEVIASIPREQAEKHKIVPLALDGTKLQVAMSDPTNLSMVDELSFSLGFKIQPVVAPQLLIRYALEKYYGVGRTSRYLGLTGTAQSEFHVIHTDVSAETGGDGRAQLLNADPAAFNEKQPSIEQVSAEMAEVKNHGELLSMVTRFAAHEYRQVAVLVVRGTQATGWESVGCKSSGEELRKLTFPFELSSLLEKSARTAKPVVANESAGSETDRWLAKSLGLSNQDIHCLPFIVNRAPVAFLWTAQPISGQAGFRPSYEELAIRFSYAVQMLYLRKRLLS